MRKMMSAIFLMVFAISLFSCGKNSLVETDNDADMNESEIEDTDNFENIKWSDLSDKSLNFRQAVDYCISIGKKLPDIDELRTLIQNCPATETGGECKITAEDKSHEFYTDACKGCEKGSPCSILNDSEILWSSTEVEWPTIASLKSPFGVSGAWSIRFSTAEIFFLESDQLAFARCIPCNKGDERVITCENDTKKLQEQTCNDSGEFINDRECVECLQGETQNIKCEENIEKFQSQTCSENGTWINFEECFECFDETKTETTCENDEDLRQIRHCVNKVWVTYGGCFEVCPETEPFCIQNGELFWSGKMEGSLEYAQDHCKKIGGRLPTISELRSLIQNCPGAETGGECNVENDCLSYSCKNEACSQCEIDISGKYSVFGDYESFWSDSMNSDNYSQSWVITFINGSIDLMEISGIDEDPVLKFRCVKNFLN
ncbi:MAG TPA: hypothetical protein PLX56_11715 [bacterium]|nr:hypothetical protein [bacterium]HQO92982.1 hypothetical protein [bacterium]